MAARPTHPCHRLRYDAPSPIHRFGDKLFPNVSNINTWIKRDDQATPLVCSGNKYRKLEYIIPDILATPNVTTIVTEGGLQSNHAAQTAVVAAKLGLECVLLLNEQSGGLATCSNKNTFRSAGNFQIYKLLGADIRVFDGSHDKDAVLSALADEGKTTYWIPMGSSAHPLGGLGYAACAAEIEEQEGALQLPGSGRFDYIFVACGSGSTLGGLVAGFGGTRQVIGIMVSPKTNMEKSVLNIANNARKLLGKDNLVQDDIRIDTRFVGSGYGVYDQEIEDTIQSVVRCEGFLVDPVYSGKAMQGMIHWITSGELAADALNFGRKDELNVLFIHTGGQTVLSAYAQ